jgi:hypothetical protein
VFQDHAHRPFLQLWWISFSFHGSILSELGASRKVGAVQEDEFLEI